MRQTVYICNSCIEVSATAEKYHVDTVSDMDYWVMSIMPN